MSDSCISIVPKLSTFPEKDAKVTEILNWLVSHDIVKHELTDCVLGTGGGYAPSSGAIKATSNISNVILNGFEIITSRTIFHSSLGIEELTCPNCQQDISKEDWDFFDEWVEQISDNITCPLCDKASEVHAFSCQPEWGFSDLGFTFWNWPKLHQEFIDEFRKQLNSDITIVYQRV